MYIPPHNRIDDRPTLVAFMRAHSFATLVTHGEQGLRATHLPVVALHDAEYGARFPHLPREYVDRMLGAIVAFAIDITRLDGRFKLSQEKLPVERERIIAELEGARDSWATETAALMRKHQR
jgi:transcriptional regulator